MWVEVINGLGAIAGSCTTIFAFIVVIFKPFRNKIMTYIKKELGYDTTQKKIEILSKGMTDLNTRFDEREKQFNNFLEEQKNINILNTESQLYQLRCHINEIYLHYMPLGRIPAEVRENLLKGYSVYKKLGGNSYIERVVSELLELPVDV